MGHVRHQDRVSLLADAVDDLHPSDHDRFEALVERRLGREPTAQIVGMREFWSLDFEIDAHVLCPRPDTESVVEAALLELSKREGGPCGARSFLDLGTGSGCLLLALLKECPAAEGIGVDISARALRVAASNAGRLGLGGRTIWLCDDWGRSIDARFDLIVSNPPYVATKDAVRLAPEVREFEPELALFAGEDGLDAYRNMAGELRRLLTSEGAVCLEIGHGQASQVATIFAESGLRLTGCRRDLAGIERCLTFARR